MPLLLLLLLAPLEGAADVSDRRRRSEIAAAVDGTMRAIADLLLLQDAVDPRCRVVIANAIFLHYTQRTSPFACVAVSH